MKSSFLWILFPALALAANCPTGGIWSEWSTKENCTKSCGACMNLTYTRTCLSSAIPNCACVGSSTVNKPCNTQACNYPRANGPTPPCCVGTPMIYNNWYHCGPLEQKTTPTNFVCPDGGIWGEWAAWKKVDGAQEYNRSRMCISSGLACPCTGDYAETKFSECFRQGAIATSAARTIDFGSKRHQYGLGGSLALLPPIIDFRFGNACPCPPLKLLINNLADPDAPCPGTGKSTYVDNRIPQYLPTTCTATFILEGSDFMRSIYFANVAGGPFVTSFLFINAAGECDRQRITTYQGTTSITSGDLYPLEFDCDLETELWNGYNGDLPIEGISAIGQFINPNQAG